MCTDRSDQRTTTRPHPATSTSAAAVDIRATAHGVGGCTRKPPANTVALSTSKIASSTTMAHYVFATCVDRRGICQPSTARMTSRSRYTRPTPRCEWRLSTPFVRNRSGKTPNLECPRTERVARCSPFVWRLGAAIYRVQSFAFESARSTPGNPSDHRSGIHFLLGTNTTVIVLKFISEQTGLFKTECLNSIFPCFCSSDSTSGTEFT